MRFITNAEENIRRHIKGTRLEVPARALIEWRRPTWRQDRLDNDRLRMLIAYSFRDDSSGVDVGALIQHPFHLLRIIIFDDSG